MKYRPKSGIDPRREHGYLAVLVATHVYNAMDAAGVNKATLARRMGVSPAYITQLLDGDRNMTLMTIAKLGVALDMRWKIIPDPPLRLVTGKKKGKKKS
jgi:transcriptional regulator with XRE-family HTH domain